MNAEERMKKEIDFLALQVLYIMETTGYSPFNLRTDCYLVRTPIGKEITVKTAYIKVRNNVNFLDSELLEKINKQPCVVNALKKDCNK